MRMPTIWLQLSAFVVIFGVLTAVCWRNLKCRQSHGFYRYFAFVALAALLVLNAPHWFVDRWSGLQLFSWLLLGLSVILVVCGAHELHKLDSRPQALTAASNFDFENTAELTDEGIYNYIRHPMYTSLILLGAGITLKAPGWIPFLLLTFTTVMMWKTATVEEAENLQYFGKPYTDYSARTKQFVPFLC